MCVYCMHGNRKLVFNRRTSFISICNTTLWHVCFQKCHKIKCKRPHMGITRCQKLVCPKIWFEMHNNYSPLLSNGHYNHSNNLIITYNTRSRVLANQYIFFDFQYLRLKTILKITKNDKQSLLKILLLKKELLYKMALYRRGYLEKIK